MGAVSWGPLEPLYPTLVREVKCLVFMGPATELSTTERYLYDKGSKGRCLSI